MPTRRIRTRERTLILPAAARQPGGVPIRVLVAVALLAIASLAVLPPAAPSLLDPNPWLARRPLDFAHQGGETEAPSNTLFAFKTAIFEKGADVVELDVHATSDGQIVVLHDATVDRTTDGTGRVDAMTLAQVKALDAAYDFIPGCNPPCSGPPAAYVYRGIATGAVAPPPGYAANDFTVPTLDEVLATFPGTLLNIEIKNTAPDTTPYEERLADLLRAHGRGKDTIVVSFNDHSTEAFRAFNDGVSTAFGLAETAAWFATAAGPAPGVPSHHDALQVPMTFNGVTVVTPDFVDNAHARGLAVHVWTIDSETEMRQLLCWGVDGIMTTKPTRLESVLAEGPGAWCVE